MARAGLTVHKNCTTEKITKDEATGKLTLHTKDGQALGDLDVVLMAIGKKTRESIYRSRCIDRHLSIEMYPSRSVHRLAFFWDTRVLCWPLPAGRPSSETGSLTDVDSIATTSVV